MLASVMIVILAVGVVFFDRWIVWLAVLAATLIAVALIVPVALLPLDRIWHCSALMMSHVTNYILLGSFFFLIVVPMGLTMRLFGNDPMHRRPDQNSGSYFSEVDRQTDAETLHDLF